MSGHAILQFLQKAKDLAALRYMTAEIAELARSEPHHSWIGTATRPGRVTLRDVS